MLKKLQKKFVILATSILALVLSVILLTINIANYVSILNNSDAILNLLIENNLQFQPDFTSHQTKFSKEIAFTTRYFTVMTDESYNIEFVNMKKISSVSPNEATSYAKQLISSGSTSGTLNNFRYAKTDNIYGYTYIFLDIQEQLMSFYSSLFYCIIIFIISVIVIFALSSIFSKNAVAPIAASYEKQKQFITDVSHEFKTPLAIIKANNEVLEIDYGENEWTTSIQTQITRLTCLVESLVSLTKLDEGYKNIMTDFSLSDALQETYEEFSAALQGKELSTLYDIHQGITYKGDENSIRQLFAILIENAIKYAPENTQIKLSLNNTPKKTLFIIENDCMGLKIGEYDTWFDRFYRADSVRNITSNSFGIGLSIAKSICTNHHAKIHAISTNGKTVKLIVEF